MVAAAQADLGPAARRRIREEQQEVATTNAPKEHQMKKRTKKQPALKPAGIMSGIAIVRGRRTKLRYKSVVLDACTSVVSGRELNKALGQGWSVSHHINLGTQVVVVVLTKGG